MNRLNKQLLLESELPTHLVLPKQTEYPEKILQFGEGNFLRGFVDWMVHQLNQKGLFNGSIVAIQPTPHGKTVPKLNDQNGLYTVVLKGIENGKEVDTKEIISSISRGINPYLDWEQVLEVASNPEIELVFSNTTEVGLNYQHEEMNLEKSPLSFPGKLTACLYHRYQVFQGDPNAGWTMIPCELVENNGALLQNTILRIAEDWKLGDDFKYWVRSHNRFCNTLVDRIVTGFPKDTIDSYQKELGYEDLLLTVGEPYHLFAIEGNPSVKELIPFHQIGLNVHWGDIFEHRELKVKILNGAHTMLFAAGYLSGKQTVLDVMNDPEFYAFVTKGIETEILPVLAIDEKKKDSFVQSVLDRFKNPYNKHFLLDISLNSISKFKVRLLPTLKDYYRKNGKIPPIITYSLAALIVFYKGDRIEEGALIGKRGNQEYRARENQDTIHFLYDTWNQTNEIDDVVEKVLRSETCWGPNEKLNDIHGLKEALIEHISENLNYGIRLSAITVQD